METFCETNGGNGECDPELNNEDCNFDGGDCCECQYQHLASLFFSVMSQEFGSAEAVRISTVWRTEMTTPQRVYSAYIYYFDQTGLKTNKTYRVIQSGSCIDGDVFQCGSVEFDCIDSSTCGECGCKFWLSQPVTPEINNNLQL